MPGSNSPANFSNLSDNASADGERELHIGIIQDDWVEYRGSRAQIKAEGVIPEDTEWPSGKASVFWHSGALRFWLRRCRPEGMKGPAKLWLEGDYWFLRIERASEPFWDREIRRKMRELKQAIYRRSPEGHRQFNKLWTRYEAACDDELYQAFRAKIPALVAADRGRTRRKSKHVQESKHE